MIPKKSNELYKEVAEDLEVSADLVEDLVQLYYKEIRKNLEILLLETHVMQDFLF